MQVHEAINKAVIGAVTYILSTVEIIYALLQITNGNTTYNTLNTLIQQALGLTTIIPRDTIQALILGPMVMSGHLIWFIATLIIINNTLIATYLYKTAKLREMTSSAITLVIITALINAQLLNTTLNPWTPELLATGLATATYYYLNTNNKTASTVLAIITSALSPGAAIIPILTPITHWLTTKNSTTQTTTQSQ
jgi:uncharacterized membrane protein